MLEKRNLNKKKRTTLFIIGLIAIFLVIGLIASVNAATYTVNSQNTPDQINHVFDKLNNGDTVIFNGGDYKNLELEVKKSVNIKNNGKVQFIGSNKYSTAIKVGNSYVNISGITIKNYGTGVAILNGYNDMRYYRNNTDYYDDSYDDENGTHISAGHWEYDEGWEYDDILLTSNRVKLSNLVISDVINGFALSGNYNTIENSKVTSTGNSIVVAEGYEGDDLSYSNTLINKNNFNKGFNLDGNSNTLSGNTISGQLNINGNSNTLNGNTISGRLDINGIKNTIKSNTIKGNVYNYYGKNSFLSNKFKTGNLIIKSTGNIIKSNTLSKGNIIYHNSKSKNTVKGNKEIPYVDLQMKLKKITKKGIYVIIKNIGNKKSKVSYIYRVSEWIPGYATSKLKIKVPSLKKNKSKVLFISNSKFKNSASDDMTITIDNRLNKLKDINPYNSGIWINYNLKNKKLKYKGTGNAYCGYWKI